MPRFQIGDEVIRMVEVNPSCPKGSIGVVTSTGAHGLLKLSGFRGSYDEDTFELHLTSLENE